MNLPIKMAKLFIHTFYILVNRGKKVAEKNAFHTNWHIGQVAEVCTLTQNTTFSTSIVFTIDTGYDFLNGETKKKKYKR